jgi:ketosteroid isomerase-like protein
MNPGRMALGGLLLCLGAALAPLHAGEPLEALAAAVRAREIAFAKTMADRDHAAFGAFVADEAIFVGRPPLRGRQAVLEGWKAYFEGAEAPFSWTPERVEVVASGTLAISSGPVFDPAGKRVGTFNSTWRREADGEWRVVLDIGCPPCQCP